VARGATVFLCFVWQAGRRRNRRRGQVQQVQKLTHAGPSDWKPTAAPMPVPGPDKVAFPAPRITIGASRWRSVFRWSFYLVRVAPIGVAAETLMNIALSLLVLYNLQLVAVILSLYHTSGPSSTGSAGSLSFISYLLTQTSKAAAIIFAIITFIIFMLTYAVRVLTAWVDNAMVARLRQDIHDKLLTLDAAFLQKFDAGRGTLLITTFVMVAQSMLAEIATGPPVRLVSMAGALYFLSFNMRTLQQQDNVIEAIFLVGMIGLPIIGWFLAVRLRSSFARARDSQAGLADEFMNSLYRPSEIQLMGAVPQRSRVFGGRIRTQARDQVAAAARRELANDFQSTMSGLLQSAILVYGAFAAAGSSSPAAAGAIFGLYAFVPMAIVPIQNVLQVVAGFTSSWPQTEAVLDLLEAKTELGGSDGSVELSTDDQSITFKDVTFAYAPELPKILDGVSHTFSRGKVTAVAARFGAGKSTVLNLIARLRQPQAGSIIIGDKNLNEIKLENLRVKLVKVSQFPLFISDTARENFRLAKADATDAEIEAVCRRTGFWDVLVKETPAGAHPLDYAVSRQDDIGLTGGQRRVFAVTRALLLRPAVLLLDEPTTGVDPIGRIQIYDTLVKACAGLTVIVADQDMNFLTHFADEVCCLENGKFVDVGSPAALMKRPSLFSQLSNASQR
jgi:ABC-type multidrug transport system fused ATPase/permease subunit